jgi:putative ABC transport system substrate-binding protein
MRRRKLMLLLGGAMTTPRLLLAQTKPTPVIGWLQGAPLMARTNPRAIAFHQGLSETGYIEGQNLSIEYRSAEGHYDRFPGFAADLVSRKVDVILTLAGPVSIRAAQNATATIPIVFLSGGDPVADKFVASLSRPGGNITGVYNNVGDLLPKRLELLAELAPQAKTIALLSNPANGPELHRLFLAMEEAARVKEVRLSILEAATEGKIDDTFANLASMNAGALMVLPDAFFQSRREQLVSLATRYSVPTMFPNPEFVAAGGLISYAPNYSAAFRLIGSYAGRILKGAKPADLPVQQPTAFELMINLKTAKALGLTVPPSILVRADKVIE